MTTACKSSHVLISRSVGKVPVICWAACVIGRGEDFDWIVYVLKESRSVVLGSLSATRSCIQRHDLSNLPRMFFGLAESISVGVESANVSL